MIWAPWALTWITWHKSGRKLGLGTRKARWSCDDINSSHTDCDENRSHDFNMTTYDDITVVCHGDPLELRLDVNWMLLKLSFWSKNWKMILRFTAESYTDKPRNRMKQTRSHLSILVPFINVLKVKSSCCVLYPAVAALATSPGTVLKTPSGSWSSEKIT